MYGGRQPVDFGGVELATTKRALENEGIVRRHLAADGGHHHLAEKAIVLRKLLTHDVERESVDLSKSTTKCRQMIVHEGRLSACYGRVDYSALASGSEIAKGAQTREVATKARRAIPES